MILTPQASPLHPERTILSLGDAFYDAVTPASFPMHRLRFRNSRWDSAVGLHALDAAQWIAHFGRFEPIEGSLPQPLALRYHGHQFRQYNPDIGDGRGFLFAQVRDNHERVLDLGTKGSGQTPYSRFGDGRLTLKGGVREVLATEMLEALGVETSKSFSLIETDEALERGDEPSPTRSAVLVRLSHGHIRLGTFQRLAYLRDEESMRRLIAYVLTELYGQPVTAEPAVQLLDLAVRRTAALAASYMAAGFVHGVLNSDNINITGESFDYGPWRFTPRWDAGFTAAYFDHNGLYAFGRQAQAIHWDVVQLAIALSITVDRDALVPLLEAFPALYEAALRDAMFARLGIAPANDADDLALLEAMERALTETDITIDRFFFDWAGGGRRGVSPADEIYRSDAFAAFGMRLGAFAKVRDVDHEYWSDAAPCAMHIDEVEAIWQAIAEADDWSVFEAKIAAIRRMGTAMRGETWSGHPTAPSVD